MDKAVAKVRTLNDGTRVVVFTLPPPERISMRVDGAELRKSLSARETQILECVADGLANKEVATKLGLRDETVKSHIKNIYEKLGAADRAHAVALALRRNIIQ